MNILIVDDQPSVLESLATTINWRSIGIDGVYSAASSHAAKEILDSTDIQILLTDIEMPVESGLQLIRWLRGKGLETECILLTSHTEFAYAREGIELGVADYVVQPAANAHILAVVKKIADKLTFQNTVMKKQMAGEFTDHEMNHAVEHFFKTWPDPEDTDHFENVLDQKVSRLNELGYLCEKTSECILFLTVIDQWFAVPLSEIECRRRCARIIHSVFSAVNGQASTYSENDSHFVTLLFLPSFENAEDRLGKLRQQIREELKCSVSIYFCLTDLPSLSETVHFVADVVPKEYEKADTGVARLYPSAKYRNLDLAPQNYKSYYEQIEEYIRANITMPITRQDMSEYIHISPDYISHIVRSIAECSCKELIAREKMKYARSLIETTSTPIGNIAVECGFDSFAYFSKVYKSIYGVSPKEARNQVRKR